MINKLIDGYNSLKISAVNTLGNGCEGLNDELDFLDDPIVASRIRFLQKICRDIDNELNNCTDKDKTAFLINRKQEFMNEIVLLASNGIMNIDFCFSIIDKNNDFIKCLHGLKCFIEGDNYKAKQFFDDYFSKNKYLIEHYLISKIYGQILFDSGDYYNAGAFLRKAVEKRPQEIELHKLLRQVYINLKDQHMAEGEDEILSILEGI